MPASASRSRTVERVWFGPRWASVPKSGLASTAITRSPRSRREGGAQSDGGGGLSDTALEGQHRDAVGASHWLVDAIGQRPSAGFGGRFAEVHCATGDAVQYFSPAAAGYRLGRADQAQFLGSGRARALLRHRHVRRGRW